MARATRRWAVGGGVLAALVTGASAISGLFHRPAAIEDVVVHCDASAPTARAGEPLKVLVWNVQYGASTKHHFFYDGGPTVSAPAEDVVWTLDAIAEVVREADADVVLLQEVDRGSDRTGRIDQHAELLRRLDLPCHASTPYFRSLYVPVPSQEHLGRVEMHLTVMSRVRLGRARRHQLALLDEPWWRQAFNLRRAVLEVEVPIDGGPSLVLLDTHLSAFSRGDGTLPKQVGQVQALAEQAVAAGHGVVLAGDFNSLPPVDDPGRLPERARALYADQDNPIAPLYEALKPAVSLDEIERSPEAYYTYAPFGLGRTDRMIDHIFGGGPVVLRSVSVRQDRLDISDHQPISVEVVPVAR